MILALDHFQLFSVLPSQLENSRKEESVEDKEATSHRDSEAKVFSKINAEPLSVRQAAMAPLHLLPLRKMTMFNRIPLLRSMIVAPALCFLLGTNANTQAGDPHNGRPVSVNQIHNQKHEKGIVGISRAFRNWTSRCYFPVYRCYGYYSPIQTQWYYWYAPFNQYLPVSLIATYPPVSTLNTAILPGNSTGLTLPLGPSPVLQQERLSFPRLPK